MVRPSRLSRPKSPSATPSLQTTSPVVTKCRSRLRNFDVPEQFRVGSGRHDSSAAKEAWAATYISSVCDQFAGPKPPVNEETVGFNFEGLRVKGPLISMGTTVGSRANLTAWYVQVSETSTVLILVLKASCSYWEPENPFKASRLPRTACTTPYT